MRTGSASNGGSPSGASVRREEATVELAEIEPAERPSGGAVVVDHCLSGLVAPWIPQNARLLASELVTNSVSHGDVEGGTIVLRMDLTAQTLRLEIENAGTVGVVELRSASGEGRDGHGLELVEMPTTRWGVTRDHDTSIWLEMGRA